MLRSLYRRDSLFMRFVSTFVAFAFTLSLAGSGFAVPAPADVPEAPLTAEVPQTAEPPVAEEPVAAPEPEADPALPEGPDASVEVPPTTSQPAQSEGDSQNSTIDTDNGAKKPAVSVLLAAPAAGGGDISIVDFQGYNSDQAKWTNGNLGKLYQEGDWVPYRLVLRNTGDAAVDLTEIGVGLDHFDSNPAAAVMFDKTRSWGYALTMSAPGTNDAPSAPAGFASVVPLSQDVPEGGSFGSAETIKTTIGAGTFSIAPNQYAVVYFQGHLAMTVYWNYIQPGTDGAGTYPGSSGHGYLVMDAGARTLPLPSVAKPGGSVKVVKFYDTDMDGVKDAGETQLLSGWTMNLSGNDLPINLQAVTGANGEALFGPLPDGTFQISETMQTGWSSNTAQPLSATVSSGQQTTVHIGNFRPDVVKTWSLSVDSLPSAGSTFVRYRVNGGALQTTSLTGSGPFTATTQVPHGATISDIAFYMSWNGQEVLLGTMADETLTAAKTNSLTYDSLVSGMKYSDDNGDGVKGATEAGLSGWTIVLKRVVGSVETTYAQAITGTGGAYSFVDVIPGTYKVYEIQQSGYFNTGTQSGTFVVGNGSQVTGLDFGNLPVRSSIEIVKSGPAAVHAGDVVEYTFLVTNTGNFTLNGVSVSDPLLGVVHPVGIMAAGATYSFAVTATAQATPDPKTNTAYVVGTDVLGNVVGDDDDHVVDIIKPAIDVTKSVDRTRVVNPGSVIYTYVVTNTGEDVLYNVTLSDDMLAVPGGSIGTLAVGASVEITAAALLTDDTVNVATATGADELGMSVTDTATAEVLVYNPAISIVKSADPTVTLPGGDITYTYLVTNTGDIELHHIDVVDDVLGPIGTIPMLAPNAFAVLHVTVPVGVDVTNIGTATGYYGEEGSDFHGSVSDSSSAVVDVVNPGIEVLKSASASTVVVGSEVTYTFVVRNTGDVDLYDVSVVDDHLGSIGTISWLPVGDEQTLTESAILTTTTVNVVVASGEDPYGNPVSDDDTETVAVYSPKIMIEKSVTPAVILAGEQVLYEFVVTNTGDIELHDIAVVDDKLGSVGQIGSLVPNASAILTMSASLSVDTTNVATATGHYGEPESDFHGTVEDDDDAFVDVVNPAISVVKTASASEVVTGETVLYTYLVTNTGDVPLINVILTDDKLGVVGSLPSLAVGASEQFVAETELTEPTTNIVLATAVDEYGHEVSDDDDAFVDVSLPFTPLPPDLTIDKSADKTFAAAGDTVRYTLTYRNIGEGPASDITIVDDFDERYVTVTDAAGGTVADGKITWEIDGPLYPEEGARTITYAVRIDSDLPDDVRVVRNTVVISEPTEENTTNNTDTWEVEIEELLPFTGGEAALIVLVALMLAAVGSTVRRLSVVRAR